ncbi:MAG: WYL domain-containing protein [Lachnospiraceae bacterium]|nr:WYL domain-containing protein [Lachnospiraceae bacterium]
MNNRERIIRIAELLKEKTDENHTISSSEILCALQAHDERKPDRGTVADDIKTLIACGMDIEIIRSTPNRYRYIGRDFDLAELKLLVDAVRSSRFITKSKSEELCRKISRLAGPAAETLSRHVEVENRTRNGNKKLFLVIDVIHQAIEKNKQISFLYFKYNENKEQVLIHNGKPYLFNPFFLVWTGEYYYMVGSYVNHPEGIGAYRVDRIPKVPVILEAKQLPKPASFDPNRYLNGIIHMFGGADLKPEEIQLLCDNSTANGIIDRFGLDTPMKIYDTEHFIATVSAAPTSVFYGWVFGFGGKVKILEPEIAVREYREMVKRVEEDSL